MSAMLVFFIDKCGQQKTPYQLIKGLMKEERTNLEAYLLKG
jgi:hypothetical protein